MTRRTDFGHTRLQATQWRAPETDDVAHRAWFALHYNLAQTRRMAAGDEEYRRVALLRMSVYGTGDLWHGYAAIRRMAWPGDREQLRRLQVEDPTFLDLFEAVLVAPALDAKLAAYERAVHHAAAPMGEQWRADDEPTNLPSPPITWSELLAED
jgi:hypothetical protein